MTSDHPTPAAIRRLTRSNPSYPEVPSARYPVGTTADLDRDSPVPLYRQISGMLARAIDRGDLCPGERIENEVILASHLGVSRPTVRRAIAVLVTAGTLVRRRGIGTSVAHHSVTLYLNDEDIVETLVRDGEEPGFTVLDVGIVQADPLIRDCLRVPLGSAVLHIRRLCRVDGATIGLIDGYASPLLATITDPQLATAGLRTLVHERLAPIAGLSHVVDAVSADTVPARLLDRPVASPLLRVSTTGFDDEQIPLFYAEQLFRGDLIRVVTPSR